MAYLHHSGGGGGGAVNHIGSGIFTNEFTGSSRIHEMSLLSFLTGSSRIH